jgi:NMD protein affecting ribosome stability and mRNA decay
MYPQYQQVAGMRPCIFCGKSIPADANMCPYCMYKYRK